MSKYDDGNHSYYTVESKYRRLVEIMNSSVEVSERKSAQVLIRSISFKFINSEFEDWKARLKGEKIRYCAIKADVDWQDAPLQAKGASKLVFYDSDGLEVHDDSYAGKYIVISRSDMETKSISFPFDPSRGVPETFKFR